MMRSLKIEQKQNGTGWHDTRTLEIEYYPYDGDIVIEMSSTLLGNSIVMTLEPDEVAQLIELIAPRKGK